MKFRLPVLALLFIFNAALRLNAQDGNTYKTPPKEIEDLVMAKPTPVVDIDSKANWMILMERSSFPGIEELAEPELRIAGLRIAPTNFGPSRGPHFISLQVKNINTKAMVAIKDLPNNMKAGNVQWSPDETQFAFTNVTATSIDLYRVSLTEKKAYKVNKTPLNIVLGGTRGEPYSWLGSTMLI